MTTIKQTFASGPTACTITYKIDDCNNLYSLPLVRWQMPSRRHVVVCERPLRSCENIYAYETTYQRLVRLSAPPVEPVPDPLTYQAWTRYYLLNPPLHRGTSWWMTR